MARYHDTLKLNDNFDEFKDALKMYEETNYVSTYIKDSTTIERARKRGVKIPMKESLKYYFVTYRCCRGGTFYYKGNGLRDTRLVCNLDHYLHF